METHLPFSRQTDLDLPGVLSRPFKLLQYRPLRCAWPTKRGGFLTPAACRRGPSSTQGTQFCTPDLNSACYSRKPRPRWAFQEAGQPGPPENRALGQGDTEYLFANKNHPCFGHPLSSGCVFRCFSYINGRCLQIGTANPPTQALMSTALADQRVSKTRERGPSSMTSCLGMSPGAPEVAGFEG